MTQSITNNAVTTLTTDMNAVQNTLTVLSAAKFPTGGAAPYTILVDSEYMLVTGGMGTTTWTVTRGVESSTPTTHNGSSNPATVQMELTAGVLQALADGGPNNAWNFLRPSGLVGATAISRYVGATAAGPPGSGTFAIGDFIIDQSGAVWVCTSAGSPGVWQIARNPYRARMYLNGTQNLPQGTWTNVNFDTVDYDDSPGATMAIDSGSSHMVVPFTGLYEVDAQYIIPSATGATRVICDLAEAAFSSGYTPGANTWRLTDDAKVGVANANYTAGRSMKLKFTAGTTLYIGAFQTSVGVNFDAGAAPQMTWFSLTLIST